LNVDPFLILEFKFDNLDYHALYLLNTDSSIPENLFV